MLDCSWCCDAHTDLHGHGLPVPIQFHISVSQPIIAETWCFCKYCGFLGIRHLREGFNSFCPYICLWSVLQIPGCYWLCVCLSSPGVSLCAWVWLFVSQVCILSCFLALLSHSHALILQTADSNVHLLRRLFLPVSMLNYPLLSHLCRQVGRSCSMEGRAANIGTCR